MKYQIVWEDGDVVKHVGYTGNVDLCVRSGGTWIKISAHHGIDEYIRLTDEIITSRVQDSTYSNSWTVMK